MLRHLLLAVAAAALSAQPALVAGQPGAAAAETPEAICDLLVDSDNAEAVIDACTMLLDAGGGTDRDRAEYHYQRANGLEEFRRYDEAVADYDRALALAPDHAYAYVNRGLTRRRSGDKAGALDDYAAALDIDPDNQVARANRAFIYLEDGLIQSAVEDLEHALQSPDGDHYAVRFNLGAAYGRLGRREDAAESFRKALEQAAWLAVNMKTGLMIAGRESVFATDAELADAMADCVIDGAC